MEAQNYPYRSCMPSRLRRYFDVSRVHVLLRCMHLIDLGRRDVAHRTGPPLSEQTLACTRGTLRSLERKRQPHARHVDDELRV